MVGLPGRACGRAVLGALGLLLPAAAVAQPGSDPRLAGLKAEIERLAPIAQGTVGVGIIHLETGRELFVNGDERFPMASTFKVPVAAALFDLVDPGRLRLDSMVTPLRIKGLLPPGIRVAHKTGTLGIGVTNDVGIIELPDGAGHVVLTVFVKEARANPEAQERTIAQIGRAAYDYFLFQRQ